MRRSPESRAEGLTHVKFIKLERDDARVPEIQKILRAAVKSQKSQNQNPRPRQSPGLKLV